MSLIATFESGNERTGAAMAEAYVVRMMRHAVESEAEGEELCGRRSAAQMLIREAS